jgi:hypothetical protein
MGPPLVAGEVEGLISFLIGRAKRKQERKFFVSMSELAPYMIGAKEESHILNRIRWSMNSYLESAGITNFFDGKGYEFVLEENIDITPSGEIPVDPLSKKSNLEERPGITQTQWTTEFIAPNYFNTLVSQVRKGRYAVLVGPKGCGKSRSAEEVMEKLGLFYVRIAMGEVRDPIELIGTKEIVNINDVPVTKYVGGLLTEAVDKGWGVILDEIDSVSPNVVMTFQKLFEEGTNLTICTETGVEVIPKNPNYRMICTANTWGFGDDTGNYAGTRIQNRSTWDRLRPKIDCDYDPAIEKQIVRPYLPEAVIHALYNTGGEPSEEGIINKIRKQIADEEIDDEMSFRSVLYFAQEYEEMGWHEGMYYFVNEFRPENREVVAKIITDHLSFEFIPTRNYYAQDQPHFIKDLKQKLIEDGFIR